MIYKFSKQMLSIMHNIHVLGKEKNFSSSTIHKFKRNRVRKVYIMQPLQKGKLSYAQ